MAEGLNDTSVNEDLFLRDQFDNKSRSNSMMNGSREREALQKNKSIDVHADEIFTRGVTTTEQLLHHVST